MRPDSEQSPSPGRAQLQAGIAGGALGVVASAGMYLRPGFAAGIGVTTADLLILLGIWGLNKRCRRPGWRLAGMGMGANVIAATASLGIPRIGVGPVVDLFGGLSWLADAAAYVVFGSVLLLRRDDVQPSLGILVGITAFLRAASALALAVLQPLEIVLSLPDFLFPSHVADHLGGGQHGNGRLLHRRSWPGVWLCGDRVMASTPGDLGPASSSHY